MADTNAPPTGQLLDEYTTELLQAYLTSLNIVPLIIQPLSGGSANWCWRVSLDPSQATTAADLPAGTPSVIVKHAEGFVKANPSIKFPQIRMTIEAAAMETIGRLLAETGKAVDVRPPAVFERDNPVSMLMMTDGGHLNLKEAYESLSADEVRSIGGRLGQWLAALHRQSQSLDVIGLDGGRIAKYIYRHAYRGLAGSIKQRGLEGEYPTLGGEVDAVYGEMLNTDEGNVCMGDFWPGNVVIGDAATDDGQVPLTVCDWEMCRIGIGATDVGQFLAEATLLDRFRPTNKGLAKAFFDAYRRHYNGTGDGPMTGEYMRRIGVHAGVHLGFWPTHVKWAGDEETLKVVKLGLRIVAAARDESQAPQAWTALIGVAAP